MTKTYRGYTLEQVAGVIDHSILKPDFTSKDIRDACELALKYGCATVCIRPTDIELAASLLAGSNVGVATVVGFPHGTSTSATKAFEAVDAIRCGATELDMVINISRALEGEWGFVESDIRAVVDAAKAEFSSASVKVIFETAYFNSEQIVRLCHITEAAGGDYVKTSTGFASAGATIENVKLMKATVGDRLKVKSSGGVRTLDQLIDYIDAGVSRSGCSATEAVLQEFIEKAIA
jgi:deoxyribose-phosphate aldolase